MAAMEKILQNMDFCFFYQTIFKSSAHVDSVNEITQPSAHMDFNIVKLPNQVKALSENKAVIKADIKRAKD